MIIQSPGHKSRVKHQTYSTKELGLVNGHYEEPYSEVMEFAEKSRGKYVSVSEVLRAAIREFLNRNQ